MSNNLSNTTPPSNFTTSNFTSLTSKRYAYLKGPELTSIYEEDENLNNTKIDVHLTQNSFISYLPLSYTQYSITHFNYLTVPLPNPTLNPLSTGIGGGTFRLFSNPGLIVDAVVIPCYPNDNNYAVNIPAFSFKHYTITTRVGSFNGSTVYKSESEFEITNTSTYPHPNNTRFTFPYVGIFPSFTSSDNPITYSNVDGINNIGYPSFNCKLRIQPASQTNSSFPSVPGVSSPGFIAVKGTYLLM